MVKVLHRYELTDKIAVIVGTRPGIVKMSPIIRALVVSQRSFLVIHTGQHYSENMDQQFFSDLGLPQPHYRIESTRNFATHSGQTAEMMKGVESALLEARPWVTVVGGDANTNLAGALAARKLGIAVAHVEAGLRSGDWRMPEEHNRVMIDHISEYLFPPTEQARENLERDNVRGRIEVVGNTVVDAITDHSRIAAERSSVLDAMNLEPGQYLLLTSHREENVDAADTLRDILTSAGRVSEEVGMPVVFPIHPRTRQRLAAFELEPFLAGMLGVRLVDPVGYLDFVRLLSRARLVITDSGGIQEEACVLGIPCVTIRENTERPETVEVGANTLAGTNPDDVSRAVQEMLGTRHEWSNPFGDGTAGKRIVAVLHNDNGTFQPYRRREIQ